MVILWNPYIEMSFQIFLKLINKQLNKHSGVLKQFTNFLSSYSRIYVIFISFYSFILEFRLDWLPKLIYDYISF